MTFWPSRISTSEYVALLCSRRRGLVCSTGSWFGRRFRLGGACGAALSPGLGGAAKPYAHNGSCSNRIAAVSTRLFSAIRVSVSGGGLTAWVGRGAASRLTSYVL